MAPLERLADALAQHRTVQIDRHRCLPCRSPLATCTACAEVCPCGAISPGQRPAVGECSGCGLCAAACRADAIVLDDPSDQELLRRIARAARTARGLTIACARSAPAAGPDAVAVGCLGRLGPELLLAAAACGLARISLVGPEKGCGGCPVAAGEALVQAAVNQAGRVLSRWQIPCALALTRPSECRIPPHPPSYAARPTTRPESVPRRTGTDLPLNTERRAFLRSALGLLRLALPAAPAAPESDPFTPSASRRRELLLWALARLAPPDGTPQDDLTWGDAAVHLTGPCHRCGVCARLCPNGALSLDGEGLSLSPQRCHVCGLCTQVCPVHALSLGEPRPITHLLQPAPVSLGALHSTRCARCGGEAQVVLPGGPRTGIRCLACALRRAPPFPTEVIHP